MCCHTYGALIRQQPIILSHKASAYNFSGTGFGLQAFTTLPLYHNHGREYPAFPLGAR